MTRLEFKADRSDLVDPSLTWNQRYARYRERFERWDDLTVVLETPALAGVTNARTAERTRADALARDLAHALRTHDDVLAAEAGFDAADAGPRFYLAAPPAQFDAMLERISVAASISQAPNANAALATALESNAGAWDVRAPEVGAFLAPYLDAIDGRPANFEVLRPTTPRWVPFELPGAPEIRLVRVQLADSDGGVGALARDIARLRERIGTFLTEHNADVQWGVTGLAAIEADETQQSIKDSTLASILAFILITILMVVVFRGATVPLLAAMSLLIGIAWSFGWLVLSVGHLQLLSVVFTVILLGLGIDFALHLTARLELVLTEHDEQDVAFSSTVERVFRGIGPGMLTGAITTAAAFGATALTDFDGMAEMGIIASGGIVLCLIAVLSCFPAALALSRRHVRSVRRRAGGEQRPYAGGAFRGIDRRPRTTLLLSALIVGLAVIPARQVMYDPNVLNLHPPGIESVEWERRLVDAQGDGAWSALVETTADDAPELVATLRALPEVSDVGAMGALLPRDWQERRARLVTLRADAPEAPRMPAGLERTGHLLASALARLEDSLPAGTALPDEIRPLLERWRRALGTVSELTSDQQDERWRALDQQFRLARDELAAWTTDALRPDPPSPDDLPGVLRQRFAQDDVWLLRVDPTVDTEGRSVLHPARLGPFVRAVQSVAGDDTLGPPVQIYESSLLIQREYIRAATYAVVAILVILLLDFRSILDTIAAMLPVSIGFLGAFALMGLFGVPLNFANIIVLPLIFGIGVDAGVHVVHRWRLEPMGSPAGLSGGTGRGITLTLITTMIGFGSMAVAEHRGIRSLGFVMVAGLAVTLVACVTVLPAWLRWRTGPGAPRA